MFICSRKNRVTNIQGREAERWLLRMEPRYSVERYLYYDEELRRGFNASFIFLTQEQETHEALIASTFYSFLRTTP